MLDYHLHLWPHHEHDTALRPEQLAEYCEQAEAAGVTEIALTEHLFRFRQADALLGGFWDDESVPPALAESMAEYWKFHATVDLDAYIACAQEAKEAGLPVVIGLEVDYYPGRMDEVSALLAGYPFDVLLGSVHWLGAWMFDDLASAVAMAEWDAHRVDEVWDDYTRALEELAATGAVDVLAHPDLCKVTGRRPAAPEEWYDRMAAAAGDAGIAAEVNARGYLAPAAEPYSPPPLLARFRAAGVPVTTASDAHRLQHVAMRSADLKAM